MRWHLLVLGILLALGLPAGAQTQSVPATPVEPVAPPTATPTPPTPPTDSAPAPDQQPPAAPEVKVLVAEVQVVQNKDAPLNNDLENQVYKVIKTRPGQTTTRTQLQEDINAVFATGYFSDVKATPEDTPLGVRVTFDVAPNPTLNKVAAVGNLKILTPADLDKIFAPQKGKTLNYGELQKGVKEVEEFYASQGYVLAKVTDVQSSPTGDVNLTITEGEIADIQVKGNDRTRAYIVTRELSVQPGNIFNRDRIQADLQRVFALNLFKDVSLELNPAEDDKKVIVALKVEEKNTGSLGAGGGASSATGIFGTLSYQEQNLGGNNQKLGFDLQAGTRQFQYNVNFTDPWLNSNPDHTALNVNLFSRDTFSYIFDQSVGLPNDQGLPRENRLGVGVTFLRPLENGWRGSLGGRVERVQLRDFLGNAFTTDALGNPLTASGTDTDNLYTLEASVFRDDRDNTLTPTRGTFLRIGGEQNLGILGASPFYTRIGAEYSQFNAAPGLLPLGDGQQILAFNARVGTLLGLFPPYEAWTLGGANSVRGYFEGDLGTARSFLITTAELRSPIVDPVSGVLFVDYGTDLATAASVLGAPGLVRNKPGSGLGYGFGLRLQSPLGPLRIDFGFTTSNSSQIHFGIGEKF
ncbi:BamA/TamA family outer membrane protein [Anthocerotibacter panamensis]|uniref:BamA/TamA family outer membrane protein n=1 Tax=Anthocerotibacter panamensis TaxID=2857077 RepID=UPI001C405E48|nr:BamA/TamA family outer membrane protein [Anthocerotibacter panamensis]